MSKPTETDWEALTSDAERGSHNKPSGAGIAVEHKDSGLTEEQIKKLRMGGCPDCDSDLYKGPCGGMMMNVRCEKGHRFNITHPDIQDIAPFFAERIGDFDAAMEDKVRK